MDYKAKANDAAELCVCYLEAYVQFYLADTYVAKWRRKEVEGSPYGCHEG